MEGIVILVISCCFVATVTGTNKTEELTVTAGEKVVLPCQAAEERQDYMYRTWKRGNFPTIHGTGLFLQMASIESEKLKDARADMEIDDTTFTLTIGTTQAEDHSVYTCYMYTLYPHYHYSYVHVNIIAGPPAGLLPGHVSAAIIGGSIALVVGIGIGIVAIALYRKHKADSPPQTWGRITFENDGQQDVLKQD